MAAAARGHPFDRCHELSFAVNLCCVIVEDDAKERDAPFHTVSRREMRGMLRSLEVSVEACQCHPLNSCNRFVLFM